MTQHEHTMVITVGQEDSGKYNERKARGGGASHHHCQAMVGPTAKLWWPPWSDHGGPSTLAHLCSLRLLTTVHFRCYTASISVIKASFVASLGIYQHILLSIHYSRLY